MYEKSGLLDKEPDMMKKKKRKWAPAYARGAWGTMAIEPIKV
jgi:hypothetical protein